MEQKRDVLKYPCRAYKPCRGIIHWL